MYDTRRQELPVIQSFTLLAPERHLPPGRRVVVTCPVTLTVGRAPTAHDSDVAARLDLMMPPGVPPIGLFRMFVRNLPMATAMGGWRAGVFDCGGLGASLR